MKDAADTEFANRMSAPFAVEDWRVEPVAGFVSREGVVVHLEPKVMEVLVLLASRAGTW